MIPIFQTPADVAYKLFREASRTWNADQPINIADHLINFCVTNSSLRDWVMSRQKIVKGEHSFNSSWRAMADGLFGVCADIANAQKHFLINSKQAIQPIKENLIALGPNGPIDGTEKTRESFEIVLDDGTNYDILMFLYKICTAWEGYFQEHDILGGKLTEHGYFLSHRY